MTIHEKELSVRKFFVLLEQETKLKIMVDPDVQGTMSISLDNEAWQDAFAGVLESQRLGFMRESDVMRVALRTRESGRAWVRFRYRVAVSRIRSSRVPVVSRRVGIPRPDEHDAGDGWWAEQGSNL